MNKMQEFTGQIYFIFGVVLFTLILSILLGKEITAYLLLLIGASMVLINEDKVRGLFP